MYIHIYSYAGLHYFKTLIKLPTLFTLDSANFYEKHGLNAGNFFVLFWG